MNYIQSIKDSIHLATDRLKQTTIYRNGLKNREFDKEGLQNFCSERETIAERQGSSENKNFEGNPTKSKTDSSDYFGIKGALRSAAFATNVAVAVLHPDPIPRALATILTVGWMTELSLPKVIDSPYFRAGATIFTAFYACYDLYSVAIGLSLLGVGKMIGDYCSRNEEAAPSLEEEVESEDLDVPASPQPVEAPSNPEPVVSDPPRIEVSQKNELDEKHVNGNPTDEDEKEEVLNSPGSPVSDDPPSPTLSKPSDSTRNELDESPNQPQKSARKKVNQRDEPPVTRSQTRQERQQAWSEQQKQDN